MRHRSKRHSDGYSRSVEARAEDDQTGEQAVRRVAKEHEIRALIVQAFTEAKAKGKPDWRTMQLGLLNKRLLGSAGRTFREFDYGVNTMRQLVVRVPDHLARSVRASNLMDRFGPTSQSRQPTATRTMVPTQTPSWTCSRCTPSWTASPICGGNADGGRAPGARSSRNCSSSRSGSASLAGPPCSRPYSGNACPRTCPCQPLLHPREAGCRWSRHRPTLATGHERRVPLLAANRILPRSTPWFAATTVILHAKARRDPGPHTSEPPS